MYQVISFISTVLLVFSLLQFLIVVLVMRPRRFKKEPLAPGSKKTLEYSHYAGHTLEQRIYQTAVLESMVGTMALIFLKIHGHI